MKFQAVVTLFIVLCNSQGRGAARILALVWQRAESHFPMFETLLKALASRGHEVFVVSHFPQKTPVKNYTDISVEGSIANSRNSLDIQSLEKVDNVLYPGQMINRCLKSCELVFKHRNIHALLKSEDKFDLIITEIIACDCFLGFVHKFKAPYIAVMASSPYPWSNDRIANPDNPAYIPNSFTPHTDRMTFWERLKNTVQTQMAKCAYYSYSEKPTHRIASKYFGDDLPPLSDIARNVSVVLVNSHFSMNHPRPTVPAVVEVGGLHIQSPKRLPQDIQTFLDEAPEGIIYFSLGSMIRCDSFPLEIRHVFIEAFTQLSLRVLWKCNADNLPALPGNILTRDWMPQRDILAHPKVRLFITHGGQMGTQEAVYFGVPMVGIPFIFDQKLNIHNYVSKGVAVMLDYRHITVEGVMDACNEVLNGPSYQQNVKKLSRAFRDRPQSALDTAIFWTEYVIRHRGAPHLRSAAVDLPWYQYMLLDVIMVVTVTIILITSVTILIIRKFWCHCSRSKHRPSESLRSRKSKTA